MMHLFAFINQAMDFIRIPTRQWRNVVMFFRPDGTGGIEGFHESDPIDI